MMRLYLAVLILFAASLAPSFVDAKAKLVAVMPLRSTAELRSVATGLTNEVANAFAAIDGFDAKVVAAGLQRDVDAAAATGAEVYVEGQVISDASGYRLKISTFDVSGDHQIGSYEGVTADAHLARDFNPRALLQPSASAAGSTSASTPIGDHLLLVPFQLPDNKDTALEYATTEFVKKMASKGVTLVQSPVIDHVEAATRVAEYCKQYGVTGVLIGTARHEQRLNYFLGSYPTHAEARLSLVDCSGATVWKGFGTGDLVYYWANAGAAVSDAMGKALDTLVTQFGDRATTASK